MSFLKKMFGKQDPLIKVEQHYAARDWAGVLSAAKSLELDTLEDTKRSSVEAWIATAGDNLAALNLEEGKYAKQSGDLLKAREHYQLAREQARSNQLKQAIETESQTLEHPANGIYQASASGTTLAGCGPSCGPADAPEPTVGHESTGLDEDSRLELLLSTCPPELSERYATADKTFQAAWLAAQAGDDERAMKLLDTVEHENRDALFYLEKGLVLFRQQRLQDSIHEVREALTREPDLFPAFEVLVAGLAEQGDTGTLLTELKQHIESGLFTGYCWARLAEIHAAKGEREAALAAGCKAFDEGLEEPGLAVLCAQLLEGEGRQDEAETLLRKLPGHGCSGGIHPLLAEHWLRRGKNLDQALESFKGALRQDRDNPRWMLRIAQAYLGKGWRKEASRQIGLLMARRDLPENIRTELAKTAEGMES